MYLSAPGLTSTRTGKALIRRGELEAERFLHANRADPELAARGSGPVPLRTSAYRPGNRHGEQHWDGKIDGFNASGKLFANVAGIRENLSYQRCERKITEFAERYELDL